jgi:hypothetical protein
VAADRTWADLHAGNLLTAIVSLLRRFLVLSEPQLTAIALWVIHTHAFPAAETTPYLAITSAEKRSGKTRLLELLELLVASPWMTGRITAAVLARKVAADQPTLLLDESDAAFKGDREYSETLRGILNTGFRQGGKVTVCVGPNHTPTDFPTFSPKAIAGIGQLPDTVADRSIPIRLERKHQSQPVERLRRREIAAEAVELHDRIADWALPNLDLLQASRPSLPNDLDDRAQDVWEPLLAIADCAGEEWALRARQAAISLSGAQSKEDESIAIQLLRDIRGVFDARGVDRMRGHDLMAELAAIDDSPWGNWFGRPIAGQAVAKILKPFGIRTMEIWLDDAKARGYRRDRFEPIWDRYLPPVVGPVGSVDGAPEAPVVLPPRGFPTATAALPGRREGARGAASTTSTEASEIVGCRYPQHEFSYVTLDDGRRFCTTCHPMPESPNA